MAESAKMKKLELRPRAREFDLFTLEETEVVLSQRKNAKTGCRVPYWNISPTYVRQVRKKEKLLLSGNLHQN